MSNNIFADQSDVFGDYYNCIETLGEDYIGKKKIELIDIEGSRREILEAF